MNARTYARDTGDTYGRHALVNPGGDNRQYDVFGVIGAPLVIRYQLHPVTVRPNYVGAHAADNRMGGASGMVRYGRHWVLVRPDGTSTQPVPAEEVVA